jgi:glycosyltransferase involved in cell wall biosynthesis
LNAFGCGVAVVASNKGSLPEIVGDAGIVVDPAKKQEISEAIERVLTMGKEEYNMLVNKGLRRAKEFSWERTARETLEVFEGMV